LKTGLRKIKIELTQIVGVLPGVDFDSNLSLAINVCARKQIGAPHKCSRLSLPELSNQLWPPPQDLIKWENQVSESQIIASLCIGHCCFICEM